MPRQTTLMLLNILLTVLLAAAFGLHLAGWRWWFPCLWFVGMAAGSLWNTLPRPSAPAEPPPRGPSVVAAGAASSQ